MPRKTDASNPADWVWDSDFTDRYPGFDLEDPDWPTLTRDVAAVGTLLETVRARTSGTRT